MKLSAESGMNVQKYEAIDTFIEDCFGTVDA